MCIFIIFMPFSSKKKTFHSGIFLSYHLGFFLSLLIGLRNKFILCIYNKYYKKNSWSMRYTCQYVKDSRIFWWCAAKRWLSCRCLKRLDNPSIFVVVCLEWTFILASTLQNSKVTSQFVLSSDYFFFNFCLWSFCEVFIFI
jgi:hypothetical protein